MKRFSAMQRSRPTRLVLLLTVLLELGQSSYAQTTEAAQNLLDEMIEALGGEAFMGVSDIEARGRFFSFARDQLVASDIYVDYIKFPDMERTEFGRDKQKTIQINKGIEGWTIAPPPQGRGDPQPEPQSATQTEEFIRNFRTSFDYMARFVFKTPEASVLRSGSEVVDFKRVDVLEVRDAEKNLMRIFLDRETRLPRKIQIRRANDAIRHEEIYANWHEFQGVMTPLMVVRYKDDVKTMEIRVESVKYNSGPADSLFSAPAKSK